VKTVIVALLIVILGVVSYGVYEAHEERTHKDGERLEDAKRTLELGAMKYNLSQCFKHLGITTLTADDSPKWRAFKRTHQITRTPIAMSDDDLRACEAL
jgi:hypothetical protein